MSEVIKLQNFYRHAPNQDPGENNVGIGHFNIIKIEDLELEGHKRKPTYSRRNFFKVSLVTGKSIIHYADRSFAVEGSILVFTNPMVPYHWEIISPEQSGYICIFTESFFSRYGNIKEFPVFQSADTAVIPINEEQAIYFGKLFTRMADELQSSYTFKYDLLRNLLMECVHEAQKLQPAGGTLVNPSNASERITGLFTELLERQFPIEVDNQAILLRSPSDFALQLNIHVNHLNKALKEITGKTTSQLINERVLQEAVVLLKYTNRTVAEIAWALGFEEPNHFSSFFKSRTQSSPVKFRQIVD